MAVLENFNTLGDVVSEALNELGEGSNSSIPGLGTAEMEKWANRFSKWFLDKVRLKSQEATHTFELIADAKIASTATPDEGDTTFEITSATGFESSGLIILDSIPMTYTLSGTTMTVPALPRDFSAGDNVHPTYALPSTFGKPRGVFVGGGQHGYIRWGEQEFTPASCFSVFQGFFIFPLAGVANTDVTIHYYSKPSNTLSSTDNMEIYDMWDAYVIYRLTARGHRLLFDPRAVEYETLAKEVLDKAKTFVGTEDDSDGGNAFVPAW